MAPLYVMVAVLFPIKLPRTSMLVSAPDKVKFGAREKLKLTTVTGTFIVIVDAPVRLEAASKLTLSAAVGIAPAEGPPELSDQWAGSLQFPVPPIQK